MCYIVTAIIFGLNIGIRPKLLCRARQNALNINTIYNSIPNKIKQNVLCNKDINKLQTLIKLKRSFGFCNILLVSSLWCLFRITLALIGLSWLVIGTVLVGFLPESG